MCFFRGILCAVEKTREILCIGDSLMHRIFECHTGNMAGISENFKCKQAFHSEFPEIQRVLNAYKMDKCEPEKFRYWL